MPDLYLYNVRQKAWVTRPGGARRAPSALPNLPNSEFTIRSSITSISLLNRRGCSLRGLSSHQREAGIGCQALPKPLKLHVSSEHSTDIDYET